MTWTQRPAHTSLGASPDVTMHGCLDALIVTLRGLRVTKEIYRDQGTFSPALEIDIADLEERAAICAGLLFDRWIEETEETADLPFCSCDLGQCHVDCCPSVTRTARCRYSILEQEPVKQPDIYAPARHVELTLPERMVPVECRACRDAVALGLKPIHKLPVTDPKEIF